MAVAIVLVILFAAAIWLFGTESGRSLIGRAANTPAEPPMTRFSGKTVANRRTVRRANNGSQTRVQGKRQPSGGRMTGSIQRSPDAIGLACGRPISECTRGDDCLCVD